MVFRKNFSECYVVFKAGVWFQLQQFGRRWEHLRRALQLWVISSGKSITSARSQLSPLLAELSWRGGSCCIRKNITCKVRGWLLSSCILLVMGALASKWKVFILWVQKVPLDFQWVQSNLGWITENLAW